jgi:hypothetical protein
MDWSLILQEWKLLPTVVLGILSQPLLVITVALGAIMGMIVGMLPGISAVMAMSLLIGFTFRVPAEIGLGLLIAIYVGAMAAGGVTAIMMNIPGTPAAAATVMDGFPMAKQGKVNEAVEASFSASFVGEILGEFTTLVLLPFIGLIALKMGDWEIFLVALVGITLAGALAGKNPLKGWIAALIGLVIAMVGMEDIWAYPRFGYTTELQRGFTFVPALIGLFGLSEVFMVLREKHPYQIIGQRGWVLINFALIKKYIITIFRSVLVAVGIGIVPGVGESAACWVGYDMARRHSKNRENFGKGEVEGVVAAEAANSACSGGALVPSLVFDRGAVLAFCHIYARRSHAHFAFFHPNTVEPAGNPTADYGSPRGFGLMGGGFHPLRRLFHVCLWCIRLSLAAARLSPCPDGLGYPRGRLRRHLVKKGSPHLFIGFLSHAEPSYRFGLAGLPPLHRDYSSACHAQEEERRSSMVKTPFLTFF